MTAKPYAAVPPAIVVLSGAGLSAESGLATFRGAGGLWEGRRAEEVATPEAFAADPELVSRFYDERRQSLGTVEPNPAHGALARLQDRWPGPFLHVTQNVDDLLERAGARPLHMHGELKRARCVHCGATRRQEGALIGDRLCRACGRDQAMRPDIVWFGEIPRGLDRIAARLAKADLFVAVGTSGHVYPAAGFAAEARAHGCGRLIEINLEPSAVASDFDEHIAGSASETVPAFVDDLLETL